MYTIFKALPLTLLIANLSFADHSPNAKTVLEAAANNDLAFLTNINNRATLLQQDPYGFTLYDYARMNHHQMLQYWAQREQIHSGVTNKLIQRMQLWFLLLNVPTNNTKGIYNQKTKEDILHYQTTRGIKETAHISPDWFNDLETEGLLVLQNHLVNLDDSIALTGVWDQHTEEALLAFQKAHKLPVTGLLSQQDILVLKASEAKAIAHNLSKPPLSTPLMEKAITPLSTQTNSDTAQHQVDQQPTEETEPSGFLISSNAKPGKLLTLQVWLTIAGFPAGELDGAMGPLTRQAIKDYQTSIKQKPTGILHPSWEIELEASILRKVQRKLTTLGFYAQDIDGINGFATELALKKYEASINLKETGELLPETLSNMFNENFLVNAEHDDESTEGPIDTTEEDNIMAEELVDESDEINELPQDTPLIVENPDDTPPPPAIAVTPQVFTPSGDNLLIQRQLMLAYLGFYHDTVDGKDHASLTEAVKAFQQSAKLSADGQFGPQTNTQLEKQSITKLQRYFQKEGLLKDAPTGTLGPKTRTIITALKKIANLPQTTELDIGILLIAMDAERDTNHLKTYVSIIEKERAERERIQTAQQYLIALGFLNGNAAGVLDSATEQAVKSFRKSMRLKPGTHINRQLMPFFEEALLKKTQGLLNQLGYRLSVDGKTGPKTTKAIQDIEAKNKFAVTGVPSAKLLTFLQRRTSERNAATNRRAPTQINTASAATAQRVTTVITPSGTINSSPQGRATTAVVQRQMPNLNNKTAQMDGVLRAEPSNTIKGRLSLVRNSKGALAGCKVNNITIAADWCEGRKENQQCRVLYRNGRVLSVRCR